MSDYIQFLRGHVGRAASSQTNGNVFCFSNAPTLESGVSLVVPWNSVNRWQELPSAKSAKKLGCA